MSDKLTDKDMRQMVKQIICGKSHKVAFFGEQEKHMLSYDGELYVVIYNAIQRAIMTVIRVDQPRFGLMDQDPFIVSFTLMKPPRKYRKPRYRR